MISPIHAKTFLNALKDNIQKYELKYGEIKTMNKTFSPKFNIKKDDLPN